MSPSNKALTGTKGVTELELQGIGKRFGALEHFDLDIKSGAFDVLLGLSGCGKTTFSPGEKVTGMIRGESLYNSTEPDPGELKLVEAVTHSAAFQGATVSCCAVAVGMEFRIVEHSARRLEPCTRVYIHIPPERIRLFQPAPGEAGQIKTH